jgi:hypothetical protein
MLSRRVERILKENEAYAKMLEYYDRTGKVPTRKVMRTFTIEQINFSRLKAESERTGKSMSKILDELVERSIELTDFDFNIPIR